MADPHIATRCPDCGRQFPPHKGILPEFQGCGRLAIPGPHLGTCVKTDDRGGFAVRWDNQSEAKPSVAEWVEANVKLERAPSSGPLRLAGYQQAIVDAMSQPGVQVSYLTPREAAAFERNLWQVASLLRDDEPSPSEATYARCEHECQERAAGEWDCQDQCERALAATRRAARG